MRWILFMLFWLLGAPAQAVTIPGVTTGTDASAQTAPAPEPDLEQKKAAYGALADVLENDTSRKELIDQLRTAITAKHCLTASPNSIAISPMPLTNRLTARPLIMPLATF